MKRQFVLAGLIIQDFPFLATGKAQALQGEGCHRTHRSRWLKVLAHPHGLLTGSRMSRFMAHYRRMTDSSWLGEPNAVAFVTSPGCYGIVFMEFDGNKAGHCFI